MWFVPDLTAATDDSKALSLGLNLDCSLADSAVWSFLLRLRITAGLLWLVSTVKRAPRNGWAGPKSSSDVQLSYNHCLNVYFKIHIPNKKERRRRKHREENLCGFFLSKSNEAVERQRSWAGRCSLSEKHSTENPPSFLRCWNKHLLTHLDLLSLE